MTFREWEKLFSKITTLGTRPFSCPLVTYPAITISISHCHCHTTTIHCLINAQCYIKSVIMVGLYFLARLRKTTSCKICNMHFKLQDSSAVNEELADLTPISSLRQRSLNSRDASRSSNLCQSALPIYIFSHSQGHLLTEYSANNNLQLQEFE